MRGMALLDRVIADIESENVKSEEGSNVGWEENGDAKRTA